MLAILIFSYVLRSPTSRIVFKWTSLQTSFKATISSKTFLKSPSKNAFRFMTISISSAPESIAYLVSNYLDSIGTCPLGKYEETAATFTLEFLTFSLAMLTNEG